MNEEALNIEAKEMALQLINGSRSDVREFIVHHDTPTQLTLKIIRCLISFKDDDAISCIVNLQSLLENKEV